MHQLTATVSAVANLPRLKYSLIHGAA